MDWQRTIILLYNFMTSPQEELFSGAMSSAALLEGSNVWAMCISKGCLYGAPTPLRLQKVTALCL